MQEKPLIYLWNPTGKGGGRTHLAALVNGEAAPSRRGGYVSWCGLSLSSAEILHADRPITADSGLFTCHDCFGKPTPLFED